MVIWSESLDRIIPLSQDFEERLIKLLWRARPLMHTPSNSLGSAAGSYDHGVDGVKRSSTAGSVSDSTELVDHSGSGSRSSMNGEAAGGRSGAARGEREVAFGGDVPMEKVGSDSSALSREQGKGYRRTWYGRKVLLQSGEVDEKGGGGALDDVEELGEGKRPVMLYAPLYNGMAAGMALCMFFSLFFSGWFRGLTDTRFYSLCRFLGENAAHGVGARWQFYSFCTRCGYSSALLCVARAYFLFSILDSDVLLLTITFLFDD